MYIAMVVSFLSGITIVVSRTILAALAQKTSMLKSTFYNYAVGLVTSLIVLLVVIRGFHLPEISADPYRLWIYLGGLAGVIVVMLSNLTVSKIPSFSMTLLLFIGQVFTGILLDILLSQEFSPRIMAGGLCVAAGLAVNMLVEKQKTAFRDDP